MRTRKEHVEYCKKQAWLQYEYDMGNNEYSEPERAIINACTTMICDLEKHPEIGNTAASLAILVFAVIDYDSMKKFIDGFN